MRCLEMTLNLKYFIYAVMERKGAALFHRPDQFIIVGLFHNVYSRVALSQWGKNESDQFNCATLLSCSKRICEQWFVDYIIFRGVPQALEFNIGGLYHVTSLFSRNIVFLME